MLGGGSSSGGGVREEAPVTMTAVKKGPWTVEEDAILIEYVKTHGPRDWSSLRSKSLLPRTGKSCRLRWVNKLRPDLKTGCKFSAEEERVVIELQAKFGNKWARIATYLPGRTDNDVKNFWSTRKKRLARRLQAQVPVESNGNQDNVFVPVSDEMPDFEPIVDSDELLFIDLPWLGLTAFTEECPKSPPPICHMEATLPLAITDQELCRQGSLPSSPPPFDHSLFDLPLLLECQDLVPEHGDIISSSAQQAAFDLAANCCDESFFDDFPAEMFDGLDLPPA